MLAAGTSSRMPGVHKLLLPFGEGPLVRRPVRVALSSGAESVAVITGFEGDAVADVLSDLSVSVVENPGFGSGQASSVEVAVDWAEGRADGLMILLGDEPEIEPAIVRRAVEAWSEFPGVALRVRYSDRPGHPVIVPLPLTPESRPTGDTGFGSMLARVVELSVPETAPPDVDTEIDYREALARLRQ